VTFEESLSGQADHKVLNVVSIQVSVMWDIAVQEELNVPHSVAVLWKEMLVNVNLRDGLSQQLESGREHLTSVVSVQEEIGIQLFLRVPEQALILEIGRHCFAHEKGTIIIL
jgi:hypothetical protein